MAWLGEKRKTEFSWTQANQAMSESRIFERIQHFLRYSWYWPKLILPQEFVEPWFDFTEIKNGKTILRHCDLFRQTVASTWRWKYFERRLVYLQTTPQLRQSAPAVHLWLRGIFKKRQENTFSLLFWVENIEGINLKNMPKIVSPPQHRLS